MTTLAEKRAALHASLEQHIGQVNRHNGAIAILDELIAEEVEREEMTKLEQMQRAVDVVMPVPQVAPARPYDAAYHENLLDQLASAQSAPVVRGTGDEDDTQHALCGKCLTSEYCGEHGCTR